MKTATKLWIGIGVLILLSPLGLILPQRLSSGQAWGEWGAGALRGLVGYVPKGLERLSGLWSAPVPDYAFKGWEEKGLGQLSFAYIISALIGIAAVVLAALLIARLLVKKGD